MRFTFLLFLFFAFSKILSSQCDYPAEVNNTLIISEVRFIDDEWVYVELTNVGDKPIFMSEFKLGKLDQWSRTRPILDLCNDPWFMEGVPAYIFLPEKILMPGKSWVITSAYDFGPEYYKKHLGRLGGSERAKQSGLYEVADKLIHEQELIDGETFFGDSVTTPYNDPEQTVKKGQYDGLFGGLGNGVFFLEHHYTANDSAVVDQVGGFFDNNGRQTPGGTYNVAGVENALGTSVLVRKNSISSGNLDFANTAGTSIYDSDWIPVQIPAGYDEWRDAWWTIGNHDDYVVDENTLETVSDDIIVDYAGKKITVPWGTRRLDEIMRNMKKKPGIAWNYVLNDLREDSLYRSARAGDKLIVHAVGNTLTSETFDIFVNDPTVDDNIVIPVDHPILDTLINTITTRAQNGILEWPRVTRHESGTDTITGEGFGLEFDTRVDSLLKYLEKPANAKWEIVWIDGVERADLKNGDILKITSENGLAKEYFIQVQTHFPSSNPSLSAITWPDIPARYRDFMGWKGDTIPNFSPGTRNYKIEIPYDVDGIPALVPITMDYNATISTTRAGSIFGTKEDRTVLFEVTAEDDSTSVVYSVELVKEKNPSNVEPYAAEPFFSEFVNAYTRNVYLEVYNPGTLPIDLRNYAFAMGKGTDSYAPIQHGNDWLYRFTVYVPGTKYVDSASWQITPKLLVPDPVVNPILQGGETFVFSQITRDADYYPPVDVILNGTDDVGHPQTWNENTLGSSSRGMPFPPNGNRDNSFYMYKVLNDSIKKGLKPIGDVNDFEVIDVWGMPDGGSWIVGEHIIAPKGAQDVYKRKPHVTKPNPERGGSFGLDNPEESEWIRITNDTYPNVPSSMIQRTVLGGVGSHFMEPITAYRSTVSSKIYQVSPGYGPGEEILGITTGTTVSEFLNYIFKEDEDQTLTFKSGADTAMVIGESELISPDDILEVVSADRSNTTYYRLDVTDEGLSSDAVLTSDTYNIEISVSPDADQDLAGEASISGIDNESTLRNIMENVTVPYGAKVTIIDGKGNYVPYKKLNYDTVYVDTRVSGGVSLDVVAEDSKTRIVYNLIPSSLARDAFILSDVYSVSQSNYLIEYVPAGINFVQFLNNIIPSYGSSLKLFDKKGIERTKGEIKADDKVVVTSANGEVSNTYYITLMYSGQQSSYYLAYVVSDVYSVNQVDYIISRTPDSPSTSTPAVTDFMQRITPSKDATAVIVDADGNEKSSGNISEGDVLKVTSADGKLIAYYDISLNVTSSNMPELTNLKIYPNPTSDFLNIDGLDAGNRIQIYTIQGQLMRDFKVQNYYETISLKNLPDGLFLIIISDKNRILGQFKAIKN